MYIPADLHKELSKRISPKIGDILLAKNGTTGIAAIVDRDVVFDIYVSLALLRFHPGNNIKFMWSAINMPETKAQFDGNLKGIGVPNLHLGEIKKTKMVVPPIEAQDEFAKFVEQSDKSKFIMFKSQFIEMFGNPIMKEKDESLPTLGKVCILKAGKFVKADSIKEKQEDGLFPCFGGNGLRGYVPSFNQEGEFPLIGRQGALCGNVQYAVGKFHATEHAVVVTPNIEMDRFWLYHLLCLLDLNRYASGAAQPGLAVNKLEAIRVFVPDLQLQKQYSEFAKQSDKSK